MKGFRAVAMLGASVYEVEIDLSSSQEPTVDGGYELIYFVYLTWLAHYKVVIGGPFFL